MIIFDIKAIQFKYRVVIFNENLAGKNKPMGQIKFQPLSFNLMIVSMEVLFPS